MTRDPHEALRVKLGLDPEQTRPYACENRACPRLGRPVVVRVTRTGRPKGTPPACVECLGPLGEARP